jgi:hypothetical protein
MVTGDLFTNVVDEDFGLVVVKMEDEDEADEQDDVDEGLGLVVG